jgi:hypothetical protein
VSGQEVRVRRKLAKEASAAGLGAGAGELVTEGELAPLPPVVQRYLRFMGVLGRPRDGSFRAHVEVKFRFAPDARWQGVDAWQYSTAAPRLARLFYMKLPFHGIPVLGRDTYLDGKGRLLVRVLDLFTVQDGQGEAFDLGELVTWLNDAVLIAPSMLLAPAIAWTATDDRSFEVRVTDCGNSVAARVFVDERGAPLDFHTRDRWYAPPGASPVRTPWTTPVGGMQRVGGRMVLATGQASWKLPEGDFTYARAHLRPSEIAFNVHPRS